MTECADDESVKTSTAVAQPRLSSSLGLLALAVVPGLAALMPGVLVPLWNFRDPDQSSYLTFGGVIWLSTVLLLAVLPLPLALVVTVIGRRRGRTWAAALRPAAGWVGLVGALAFIAVAVTTGGF